MPEFRVANLMEDGLLLALAHAKRGTGWSGKGITRN
jgi:hypothetical protein